MTQKLAEERKILESEELIEEYDNGGGQSGTHKNPRFDAYNNLMGTYIRALKQYAEMTGNNSDIEISSLENLRGKFKVAK